MLYLLIKVFNIPLTKKISSFTYINKNKFALGFSLIELLVAILIISSIATISININLNNKHRNQRDFIIEEIKSALIFAKHYAMENNIELTICPSKDSTNCSNDWSSGYIVFSEDNFDNREPHQKQDKYDYSFNYKDIRKVIKKFYKFPNNLNKFILQLNAFGVSNLINNSNKIIILKNGYTHNNGHFTYIDKSENNISYICWNKQIRIYTSNNGCSS